MRIATYNVNGINGRLANLLGWLQESAPDIVCLQELKAPDEKFPAAGVDREVRGRERSSDHAPVWIELADAKTGSRQRTRRPGRLDAADALSHASRARGACCGGDHFGAMQDARRAVINHIELNRMHLTNDEERNGPPRSAPESHLFRAGPAAPRPQHRDRVNL
jgi:hypothetical protein